MQLNPLMLATAILPMLLTGCGRGAETAERVAQDMVANMNEMAAILASVTDEPTAQAAVPKIDAVRAKMRDCAKRAQAAPKIDAATEAKLDQTLKTGMADALISINEAQQRLLSQPKLWEILAPALQNMDKDL